MRDPFPDVTRYSVSLPNTPPRVRLTLCDGHKGSRSCALAPDRRLRSCALAAAVDRNAEAVGR